MHLLNGKQAVWRGGLDLMLGGSAAGPLKVLLLGQSGDYYTINTAQNVLTPETLVADDQVIFWWHDRTNDGAAGVQSVTLNATTVATDPNVTAGMVAMANTFMRQTARQVHLVIMAQSGTEPREVMDDLFIPTNADGEPKRRWQDDWALHDAVVADGVPIHIGWHSWFAAPGTYADDFGKAFAAYLWGRDLNGDLLTYSEVAPLTLTIASNDWSVSRTLRDMFGGDGPKWVAMGGSNRFPIISEPDMINATTLNTGSTQFSFVNKQASTEAWRADVVDNPAFASYIVKTEQNLNAFSNGEDDGAGGWDNPSHPSGPTDDGINYRGRQTAHSILRAAGITSYSPPTVTHAEWQTDGSYMEFWSSAGPITTLRIARSEATLPATYPHWTDVVGVQIDGVPAENVQIVSGRVRVYPNSGTFRSTTVVTYGEGGSSGMLQFPEDHINELYKNIPIVDVGLPDVEGLPLGHLPDAAIMASTVPGLPSFTLDPSGPWFVDPASIGANSGTLTFYVAGSYDASSGAGAQALMNLSGTQVKAEVTPADGAYRLVIKDSAGATALALTSTASGILTENVYAETVLSIDLANQYARLWVDGTLVLDEVLAANTGSFQTGRLLMFGTSATDGGSESQRSKGTFERMAIWKEATTDGTLPVSTPYVDINGDDATVALHPWKQP